MTSLVANNASDQVREHTETLVANSSRWDESDRATLLVTPEPILETLVSGLQAGGGSPTANIDEDELAEYPDGTIGAGPQAGGGSRPTGNADAGQRDTGSNHPDDYPDGTIGGGL